MPLLRPENLDAVKLEDGDAGIILRRDGTMKVFTSGLVDVAHLTERQKEQAEQLMILAYVLQNPEKYAEILDKLVELEEQGIEFVEMDKRDLN